MPHLNEVKYAGMEIDGALAPKMNEREHEWLTIQGVSPGGTLNERWYELFGKPGPWNQAAHEWLTDQGVRYPAHLNERWFMYWLGEIIIPPPPSPDYDPLELHPDWTAVAGPSTLRWASGEVIQDTAPVNPGTLVYMNSSLGTDVVGQFRATAINETLGQSFNIVCRATDSNNFTGLRIQNGVYELWECTAGAFVQRQLLAPPPVKNDLVQLILQGNAAFARINGINYKSGQAMTRLGAGYSGVVSREGATVPISMGIDYGYLVSAGTIVTPDLTMTTGTAGQWVGFAIGSVGSITPTQLTDGNDIQRVRVNSGTGRTEFRVEGLYPQDAFTSMEIIGGGGGVLNTAAANYSQGAMHTLWQWNGTSNLLIDATVYAVDFL
jgi:hypothetical protein